MLYVNAKYISSVPRVGKYTFTLPMAKNIYMHVYMSHHSTTCMFNLNHYTVYMQSSPSVRTLRFLQRPLVLSSLVMINCSSKIEI